MKLLFDQNLSPRLIDLLASVYPDSSHVQKAGLECSSDEEVWRYAKENGYAIVTRDADFHERSIFSGHPPKIVWIRRGNCSTTQIMKILENHADDVKSLVHDPDTGVLVLL